MSAVPERVADGVWVLRAGRLLPMNVYLLQDKGQVTAFDSGSSGMGGAIAAVAEDLGGLRRIVIGNPHADHRGAAPALGAPVYCHPRDKADLEGDGGEHYFDYKALGLPPARIITRRLMSSWDGGPVEVAGTLSEGDD